MRQTICSLTLLGLLAACGGSGSDPNPVTTGPFSASVDDENLPAASQRIQRYEELDEANGSGYAQSITYNADTDEFSVDNIPFDGDNTYQRDNVVPSLGPFSVYENDSLTNDALTGTPVSQLRHKAIRGVSTSGNTEFAIVRTGSYTNYGFGGFVYQRNTGVNLPNSGFATYSGDYAGVRDFQGRGGIEYTVGRMTIDIDFEDLNDTDAVKGTLFDREVFDENGNNITTDLLTAISTNTGVTYTQLPTVFFAIPGNLNSNGELTGDLQSNLINDEGVISGYESGNYFAVIGGANAEEVVGIIVVESADPRVDSGVTARETGGFILYR